MCDSATHKPIRVSTDAMTGPYIMIPTDQLDRIRSLLDEHRVPF